MEGPERVRARLERRKALVAARFEIDALAVTSTSDALRRRPEEPFLTRQETEEFSSDSLGAWSVTQRRSRPCGRGSARPRLKNPRSDSSLSFSSSKRRGREAT